MLFSLDPFKVLLPALISFLVGVILAPYLIRFFD
jgi:hypothetical protein